MFLKNSFVLEFSGLWVFFFFQGVGFFFFFQAEDGIRDFCLSRGLGDVYKRQEHIEKNGFLMLNAHKTLPSVSSLGYSMQDLVSLIENRKVFYCKALGKKPVYLSVTAYQLLKRAKPAAPLSEAAKEILKAMEKREAVDKADLKLLFPMDAKAFQKEFDYLLEHLYLTACAGKKLNSNWYSYLYCTARKFDRCVEGLHFHGNPKEALWNLVKGAMDKKNFELLCK